MNLFLTTLKDGSYVVHDAEPRKDLGDSRGVYVSHVASEASFT